MHTDDFNNVRIRLTPVDRVLLTRANGQWKASPRAAKTPLPRSGGSERLRRQTKSKPETPTKTPVEVEARTTSYDLRQRTPASRPTTPISNLSKHIKTPVTTNITPKSITRKKEATPKPYGAKKKISSMKNLLNFDNQSDKENESEKDDDEEYQDTSESSESESEVEIIFSSEDEKSKNSEDDFIIPTTKKLPCTAQTSTTANKKRRQSSTTTTTPRTKSQKHLRKNSTRKALLEGMNTLTLADLQKLTSINDDDDMDNIVINSSKSNKFEQARNCLLPSRLPPSPPCREKESCEILSFITTKLDAKAGGCLYVCGVPGVGKTAIVCKCVRDLMLMTYDTDLPEFKFIFLNGMKLNKPQKVYTQLYQSLYGGIKRSPRLACKLLHKYFSDKVTKLPIVLLLDEVDYFYTRNQDILYNFFDWPNLPYSKLIVIAIANTMDLPETMMKKKVQSRLGLNRINFPPYTFKQLVEIVHVRLNGLDIFDRDSLDLICRKVAAISGDVRRLLQICTRTVEIAEQAYLSKQTQDKELITIEHVQKTFHILYTSPKSVFIKNLTLVQRQVMEAIHDELFYSGKEVTTLSAIHDRLGMQLWLLELVEI
ncbi:unnamed protein product [Didymodactylos carnosus]|uniref:Origin recognition complex subunit 1 n=2 Tax=Didymodactylos carnosus TaxID=1234261 RepID=A0A814U3R7_9BILA|nr:unnamed protein product [Didymodactylos carnosus]CAF3934930.1 unnamed protein product [Didymodactylos carnosus]